ncbi:hypothetical protein J3R83DRAFT_13755 [Lanmaoa asiatica]|nr:hypothetical protein J3R83DRAFT_13755 [Lanmaoa asiatica]
MTIKENVLSSDQLWRPDIDPNQSRGPTLLSGEVYRPDILAVIERTIDALCPALRTLSDKIHGEFPKVFGLIQTAASIPSLNITYFDDRRH